jgi:hypothetical protein
MTENYENNINLHENRELSLTFKFISMEKKQLFSRTTACLLGLVFGVIVTFFVLRSAPILLLISKPCPPTLTEQQVREYMIRYHSTATAFQDTLKGFNVDIMQFNALNCLFDKNPQLAAFRIYFGVDPAGAKTTMIVGVDGKGKDVRTLYYNSLRYSGPCPPICDTNIAPY